MPHRTDRDKAISWLMAAAPLPTGMVMALFSERFTSRSWRFAGGIPGGYTTWSGVLLTAGVLMLAAMWANHFHFHHEINRTALLIAGMTLVGLWWFLLGALFLATAVIDPLANPLGAVVWWTVGSIYGIWAFYERRHLH